MSFILLICTWGIIISAFFRVIQTLKAGRDYLIRLHQIPCSRCQYFTQDYSLKCTVHPYEALTEEAINCLDFEASSLRRTYPALARYLEQSAKDIKPDLTAGH
jgi:hypothetical protein